MLRSLWKHLKSQRFQEYMLSLNESTKLFLHDFSSGGRKVALHNAAPRGTTVPRGIAWCIICPPQVGDDINLLFSTCF